VAAPAGTHRLYLDILGDEALDQGPGSGGGYLAFLGVWFRQADDYASFAEDLARMKRRVFGPRFDEPVLFRRRDIINRRGPFHRLKGPDVAERFQRDLATCIERARFTLVSVVLDKHQMFAGRPPRPGHPTQDGLVALLKRYCGWLGFSKARGDVMAQSRGGREDLTLKAAYRRIFTQGTRFMRADRFQAALTSGAIKIRPRMANVAGLQLAALLAQPVLRSRLAEHQRKAAAADEFDQALLAAATPKYNMKEDAGQVSGYGTVWISVPTQEADPGDVGPDEKAAKAGRARKAAA
jgi:hypothetical protein